MDSIGIIGGVELMRVQSDLIDRAIERIAELAALSCVADDVCIAATGGYGRQELSPYSDVDITFIANSDNPEIDSFIKCAYRLLMDVFLGGTDLKVGYSYRQVGDCHDLPLDTQTALLDARRISGSAELFDRFSKTARKAIGEAAFVIGHMNERSKARQRWGISPLRVEPNIKEGAGGLRDFQTSRWLAQVALGSLKGIASEREMNLLDGAAEFLARVRGALHAVCGRGNDILSVDRQEAVAEALGFSQGPQALMAEYYAHAERIAALYHRVSDACMEMPLQIEPGIVAQRGKVDIRDHDLLLRDSEAVVRVFGHCVELGLELSGKTTAILQSYIGVRKAKPTAGRGVLRAFAELLPLPDAGLAMNLMAQAGILQWLLPEFGAAMHQVPDDGAHELTIGAHSVQAVELLEGFRNGDDPDLREAWAGISDPGALLLAVLLHDIGKTQDKTSHCDAGGKTAAKTAERLGLRPDSIRTLEFLVRSHLVMSETARLRDLSDQRTAQDFIGIINSRELLDMIYLLTAADVQSVGQKTWGEVQMRFLRELYHRASNLMRRSAPADVDLGRHRSRLARELSLANLPQSEVDEHCGAMPAAYLLNTSADDLAAHIEYVRKARAGHPIVALRDDPISRFTEITICSPDDPEPGLLAKIAGVLSALDVDIHAAQVFTREANDRIAFDILSVDYDRRALPELKKLQIQSELENILAGRSDLDSLCRRYGKKLDRKVKLLDLQVMSHLSDQHSVIQVEAEDMPGLLHRLTAAISSLRWDIHSARINTWGNTAQDVFYVTDDKGSKLDPATAGEAFRKTLLD